MPLRSVVNATSATVHLLRATFYHQIHSVTPYGYCRSCAIADACFEVALCTRPGSVQFRSRSFSGPTAAAQHYGQRHGVIFCKLWRPVKRKRGQTGGLLAFPVTNVTEPFRYSRWLQRAGFSIPMNPTYPLSGGAWTVASVARALNSTCKGVFRSF